MLSLFSPVLFPLSRAHPWMGSQAHWLWHKDPKLRDDDNLLTPILTVHSHTQDKESDSHCTHRSFTRLEPTRLTILLHVMYSMSGHDVPNYYAPSHIININYLPQPFFFSYNGAAVISGWKHRVPSGAAGPSRLKLRVWTRMFTAIYICSPCLPWPSGWGRHHGVNTGVKTLKSHFLAILN